jgi:hypothetical protein
MFWVIAHKRKAYIALRVGNSRSTQSLTMKKGVKYLKLTDKTAKL